MRVTRKFSAVVRRGIGRVSPLFRRVADIPLVSRMAKVVKRKYRQYISPVVKHVRDVARRAWRRTGRRLDRIARKMAVWPWAQLWKIKRTRPYIKPLAKFSHEHHRVTAGLMTVLFVFSVSLPILQIYLDSLRYRISTEAASILQVPNPNVTKKLQYNPGAKAFEFNAEAKRELDPSKNPVDALKHQVGGGGEEDEQLYSADISQFLNKGVTYHENQLGLSFTLTPEFAAMEGKYRDGWLVYPLNEVNGQLIYTVQANGLKEDIVLYEHPGADKMTATYKLDLPDSLEARLLPSGEVGLYSADPALFGNISYGSSDDAAKVEKARKESPKTYLAMTIPAPLVFGQDGKRLSEVTSKFSLSGDTLTVITTGLDKAEYPLSIDPSIIVDSASEFRSGNLESNVDINGDSMHRGGVTGGGIKSGSQESTTSLSTAVRNHAALAHNGYMYAIGGTDENGDPVDTVQYAAINSNGELGTWSALSGGQLLPDARTGHTAVIYNEYIYVIGGLNDDPTPAVTNTVFRAAINSGGSALGNWTELTDDKLYYSGSDRNRMSHASVAYNGNIYVLGGAETFSSGTSGTALISVYTAAINADGSLGDWSATNSLSTTHKEFSATVYDNKIYVSGGINSSDTKVNLVRYAPINSDGTLAEWQPSGMSLDTARSAHSMTAANGYLYVHGGDDGSAVLDDLLFAPIYANGKLGEWSEIDTQTAVAYGHILVHYNGFLYIVGGASSATSPVEATGGDSVYDSGGYTYHEFTSTGSSNFVVSTGGDVEYLLVGGGGGGGRTGTVEYAAGGGGAGGVSNGTHTVSATTYPVVVGTGGAGATSNGSGSGGSAAPYNSTAFGITAHGGGGGGNFNGVTGGSGGGGAGNGNSGGGVTTSGEGNVGGGSLIDFGFGGGGGGGYGAAGSTSAGYEGANGGNGGTIWGGFTTSGGISTFGGGGGGGGTSTTGGNGGSGGGGTGANLSGSTASATAGAANTGGGGGGGGNSISATYANGAAGGSGIVVIRYPSSNIREQVVMAEIAPAGNLSAGGGSVLPISKVADRGSTNTTTSQTSTAVTMSAGGSISTGNYLIARLVLNADVTTFGVTDPRGNSWTTTTPVPTNGTTQARLVYARVNTAYQNNDQITFTYGSTNVGAKGIVIEEWQNIHATNPVNPTGATTSATGTSAGPTVSLTPTMEGQLVYGALGRVGKFGSCAYTEDTTNTTGGSWQTLTGQGTSGSGPSCSSNHRIINGAYKVVTTTSQQIWNPEIDSAAWAGILVVFNPATGDGFYTEQSTTETRRKAPVVVNNGYVYVIGGEDGSGITESVKKAAINSDGSLGSWATETSLVFGAPGALRYHAAAVYNGWMYVSGGENSGGSAQTRVQRASINGTNGVLSAWNTVAAGAFLPEGRSRHQMQAYNGYLYVFGGYDDTDRLDTVEMIAIDSSGALDDDNGWLGSIDGVPQLPAARSLATAVIHDGYAYVIGGEESGSGEGLYVNTVFYAPINSDGTLGTWDGDDPEDPTLNTARKSHSAFVYNGIMYVTGGHSSGSTGLDSVEFAAINSNGTVDEFTTAPSIATGRKYHGSFAYNGNIYTYGGENSSSVAQSNVEYARINNGGSGIVSTYAANNAFTTGRSHMATVVYGDYIYMMGGISNTGSNANLSAVVRGEFNVITGAINWAFAQQSLPSSNQLAKFGAVAYNGYMYVIGGANSSGTAQTAVYYAPINSDGSLDLTGGWTSTTSLPEARYNFNAAAYDGRVYVIGGHNGTSNTATVYHASFQENGGLDVSWDTSSTSITTARSDHQLIINNGYAYVIGGHDGTNSLNDVQYGAIGSGGDITTWSYTTSLPEVMRGHGTAVANGYLYITGGLRGSGATLSNSVTFIALNANGTLGQWQKTLGFTTARSNHGTVIRDGYLYVVGGATSTSPTPSVYRGSLAAQGRKAVYSKQFDISTTAVLSNIEVNGFRSGDTEIYVRTASSDGAYGSNENLEDVTYASEGTPGLCLIPGDAAQYVQVTVVFDDVTQAAFGDIADLESRLTGITVESQPDRAPPDKRLRGGKWFTDSGEKRPFDTCGFAIVGGDNIVDQGGYRYHEFTSTGTQTLKAYKADNITIDYLIVGGGGGGGSGGGFSEGGGGGGAGGVVTGSTTASERAYTISVGSGGVGGDGFTAAESGENSTAFSQTAVGGGYGGSGSGSNGDDGGSGGGGGSGSYLRGAGTANQGNDGGDGDGSGVGDGGPGGGGGADAPGTAGGASDLTGGNGGAGEPVWGGLYNVGGGGGGGGDSANGAPGTGAGAYGGGDGADILEETFGEAGMPNTGGGGGGGAGISGNSDAGAGGSGIVVVRYDLNQLAAHFDSQFERKLAKDSGRYTTVLVTLKNDPVGLPAIQPRAPKLAARTRKHLPEVLVEEVS